MRRLNCKVGAFVNAYVHHSLEDALRGIAKAGFKSVELLSTPGLAQGLLKDPADIITKDVQLYLDLCKRHGLSLNGLYYYKGGSTRFDQDVAVDTFKKLVDVAVLLGSPYVTTDTDEVDSAQNEKRFYKYISAACDYARAKNITVCLDIHGNWCCSGKRAAEIIEKTGHPNLGVNYCTGNVIYYSGAKPEEDIKYVLPHIRRIHIKDSAGMYRKYDFPALGEGSIDFEAIFTLLAWFRGPINAEVDFANERKSLDEINIAFKKSNNFLKNMGFTF
jgi:sugar phosphate isomerase/epimerase